MTSAEINAPSFLAVANELLTPFEFAHLALSTFSLLQQPSGSGEPVLVLPGMGTNDTSTLILRSYLNWLGYSSFGWGLGKNTGNLSQLQPAVGELVSNKYDQDQQPIAIIGWSLGGVIAREIARDYPTQISQVITMGCPIGGGPKYTAFGQFCRGTQSELDSIEEKIAERERRPIKTPITSIYSKHDGVVGWKASIDTVNQQTDHIEVSSTHLGLGISPSVFKVLAQKLSSIKKEP